MCSIQVQIGLKYWFLRVLEPKISPRVCHRSDLNSQVPSLGDVKLNPRVIADYYIGQTDLLHIALTIIRVI